MKIGVLAMALTAEEEKRECERSLTHYGKTGKKKWVVTKDRQD